VKIYFANAEKSSHRSLLSASGVTRYAINLTHLAVPKKKELDLSVMCNGGEVVLYTSESDEDVTRYDDFLRQHYENIAMVIGRPDYDGAWLNERYIPLWNDGDDLERLAYLCQRHGRAAVSDKAVNGKNISRIRNLIQRWDAKLVGLSSKPDVIESLPWDSVVVGSWTSAVRYGETQVWDGHGLRRYPAQQKDSARKKHRADIIRLGIDYEQIVQDDNAEVAKLAIKSWQAWEQGAFGVYDPANDDDEQEIGLSENSTNPNDLQNIGNVQNVASGGTSIMIRGADKRHEDEKVLLPVIGIQNITPQIAENLTELEDEGNSEAFSTPVLQYQSNLLRQCNHCYLSSRCPAFKENSDCGFKLPVEIKTKDQLQAAMRALLEMQMSRVLFARFAEELEGQGLDPALSDEVERLFSLVEKFKDISDTRDVMRLEVEARGGAGVLSRIFGAQVGEATRQLTGGGLNANQADSMYADILDLSDEA